MHVVIPWWVLALFLMYKNVSFLPCCKDCLRDECDTPKCYWVMWEVCAELEANWGFAWRVSISAWKGARCVSGEEVLWVWMFWTLSDALGWWGVFLEFGTKQQHVPPHIECKQWTWSTCCAHLIPHVLHTAVCWGLGSLLWCARLMALLFVTALISRASASDLWDASKA